MRSPPASTCKAAGNHRSFWAFSDERQAVTFLLFPLPSHLPKRNSVRQVDAAPSGSLQCDLGCAFLLGGVARQPQRPQAGRLFAHRIQLRLVLGHGLLSLAQLLFLLEQRLGAAACLVGIHAHFIGTPCKAAEDQAIRSLVVRPIQETAWPALLRGGTIGTRMV